uniref:Uncharacterized protein n=1 Tax=Oryza brachyantha TaxID=4533 RepID=J3MPR1_ORYBR
MAMAGWSPELAMDAYLHTLQLCKQQEEHADDASDSSSSSSVLRCVDFAVVDASLERCGGVLGAVDVNPRGAIVVVTNVFQEETTTRRSSGRVCSYGQVVGKKGRATVLPIGRHGIEVTRVGGGSSGAHLQPHKKVVSTPKRTFLVCDDGSPS